MNSQRRWIATDAPLAGRYDDCFFISDLVGWAINGAGQVIRTDDGARNWHPQQVLPSYLRCMGMADANVGWIGCTSSRDLMYMTTDGGVAWNPVPNLPRRYNSAMDADAGANICGLHVLGERHIFASGSNNPEFPARFMKSEDGGVTWKARDMEDIATCLIDIYFQTPEIGWVVGGRGTRPQSRRSDVLPVVLKTEDGGLTWRNMVGRNVEAPLGEWGWKIQFVTDRFVVVALENFKAGAILISKDGGDTWQRIEIRNGSGTMINGNLEGIGFLDERTGWVGGWGDIAVSSGRTSGTTDGGKTWSDLTESWPEPLREDVCPNDVDRGQYLNRFRFTNRFGYASGNTVYKFTDEDVDAFDNAPSGPGELLASDGNIAFDDRVEVPIAVKPGTQSLKIDVFDRFAGRVKTLVDVSDPTSGSHVLDWDLTDEQGNKLAARQYLVRAESDGVTESRLLLRNNPDRAARRHMPHLLRAMEEM